MTADRYRDAHAPIVAGTPVVNVPAEATDIRCIRCSNSMAACVCPATPVPCIDNAADDALVNIARELRDPEGTCTWCGFCGPTGHLVTCPTAVAQAALAAPSAPANDDRAELIHALAASRDPTIERTLVGIWANLVATQLINAGWRKVAKP